jgi:hypothetical protein
MEAVRRLAYDPETDRDLYILSVNSVEDIPDFVLNSKLFGVLFVWDSSDTPDQGLVSIGKKLIGLGAAHFCTWGPDCERLHDAIDHADHNSDRPDGAVLMTTWHDKEPLKDALWFFLNTAFAHGAYDTECRASIAIVVNNPTWAQECAEALEDPRAFSENTVD